MSDEQTPTPTRPPTGRLQLISALMIAAAAVIAAAVITSTDFAADFDGGTRSGGFAGGLWFAAIAVLGGLGTAIAAAVTDRALRRVGITVLLLIAAVVVGFFVWILLGYYA